tara:strand:+ start:52 stop:450 length:399 start_codon:yes stop_codon:yes gene_type:complete
MEELEKRLGSTTLSKALGPSLERLSRIREGLPPEARNPPSAGNVVPFRGHLSRTLETITKEYLVQEMLRLEAAGYVSQQMDSAMQRLRFEEYFAVLKHLTPAELKMATDRYKRLPDSEYFPKPGKLLALSKL